ncbi:MAG TPA: histidine phosphatase family protein [Burkholderiaceae bacterium]|nr:histidine phosphatase family protein [Burkholderiaceae bacterium]
MTTLRVMLLLALLLGGVRGADADEAAWSALRDGGVLVLRHAQTEPGIGDPPGFRLEDCATQRNLSPAGRAQAAAIGRVLAERRVPVARVESSLWCRCLDTARLAFPALEVQPVVSLNSFFEDRSAESEQTREVRARIAAWRGPGALVLVTHQVNISALAARLAAMGEGIVLQRSGADVRVVGSVRF